MFQGLPFAFGITSKLLDMVSEAHRVWPVYLPISCHSFLSLSNCIELFFVFKLSCLMFSLAASIHSVHSCWPCSYIPDDAHINKRVFICPEFPLLEIIPWFPFEEPPLSGHVVWQEWTYSPIPRVVTYTALTNQCSVSPWSQWIHSGIN